MEKYYIVGKIVNTHGIRGEVRVISSTDFPDLRYKKGNVLVIEMQDKKLEEVTVSTHRKHKQFDLLQFEGYTNVNVVEKFKGTILKVPENQLVDLEDNEFYFHEIIGCTVVTEDGEELGRVKEILTPGANDVWVVQREKGKDALIPYIEDVVKEVDIKQKRIKIHVMEGLLD